MANPANTIKESFKHELEPFISRELAGYVANEGGVMTSSLSWTIEETPDNTYSYQPQNPETVPGYRKKDGTYVDSYKRKASPIKVPVDENFAGLDAAITRAIGMFVYNLQSKV